jgi:hypothetical protein
MFGSDWYRICWRFISLCKGCPLIIESGLLSQLKGGSDGSTTGLLLDPDVSPIHTSGEMSILWLPFKSPQRRLFVAFKAGLGTVINVDEWLIAMNGHLMSVVKGDFLPM